MSKIGETKKRILDALRQRSKTLTDLSNELGLAPPTISEHIDQLREMGAIRTIDDTKRKWVYYEITPGFTVWFLGTLTNASVISPATNSISFVIGAGRTTLTLSLNKSFYGPYSYQQYANLRFNVTNWPVNYPSCGTSLAIFPQSNVTCKGFTLQMTGLTAPSGSTPSGVQVNVYYNKVLTNASTISQFGTGNFLVSGHKLTVSVSATIYNYSSAYAGDAGPDWAQVSVNAT